MAVIDNGEVIQNADKQTEGSVTRVYPHNGAPTAGTTYDGIIQVGEFVEDVVTGNLYEYTEPAAVPTFTRIDTV
jgi:hypothetical protein